MATSHTGRLVKSKRIPRHLAASIQVTHLDRLETVEVSRCCFRPQHDLVVSVPESEDLHEEDPSAAFEQHESVLREQHARAGFFAISRWIKTWDSSTVASLERMAYEGGSIPCSKAHANRSAGVLQQQFVQQVFASRQPQVPPWHG
ncbi:hypothetical protein SH501x_002788 [Pirellulaceae bacterium SH501]